MRHFDGAAPEGVAEYDLPFRLLADHLPALCFMSDASGHVRWCNRRWYDYTGAPPDIDPQSIWQTFLDPAMQEEADTRLAVAIRSGEPGEMVVLFRGADTRYRPFLTRAEPVRGADGAIECWLGTMTEIGEQWEAEQNGRFLVELADALRDKSDPAEILQITGQRLGTHLGVIRVGYGEMEADENQVRAGGRGWQSDDEPRLPANAELNSFGQGLAEQLRAGTVSIVADTLSDPTVGACAATHLAHNIQASITVPLVKGGRLAAFLYAHSGSPRAWRNAEVQLVREVAERTWATLARASAETARRQTEERFRSVIETAHEGIWMVDSTGQTLFINERMAELLGTTRAEMIGRPVAEYACPEDLEEATQRIRNNLAGKAEQFEFRFRRPDSGILPVLAATAPLWGNDGEVIGAVGMFSDLTERKLAEDKMRASEALLAAFMKHAPIGMYLKDAEGRYLLLNPEMAKVFDLPTEEVVGRSAADLFGPDEAAMIATHDREVLETMAPCRVEEYLPDRADYSWSLVVRFPIVPEDDQPIRIGGFDIDISDRKRAEAELRRSREALYQSEKLTALGSLLAGVSHELNNPLSVVLTLSQLLEQKAAGTPFGERAAKISAAAARCGKIVQTFLAMARQKAPTRRSTEINDMVGSALDLVSYSLQTAGIAIVTEFAPGLPQVEVDADQLSQVMVNLLVNAHHALLDSDGARVLTVRTSAVDVGRTVRIEVKDTGPGIPPEIRRRIFDPFFTSKPQGQGTGIGLTFSLGVVEAHGGSLRLEDPPGGGACFSVELPAQPAGAAEASSRTLAKSAMSAGHVLVVDDEPDLAEALAELLEGEGYHVDVAKSGRQAQALIAAAPYDFILTDVRMPDVDGPALLRWIERSHPHLARRLAFVTGDTLSAGSENFLLADDHPTLEKPFDLAGLRKLLVDLRAEGKR